MNDAERIKRMQEDDALRQRLGAEGWGMVTGGGRAKYTMGGKWLDAKGEPCPAPEAPKPAGATLADEARARIDNLSKSALAKYLMGDAIDMTALDRILVEMTVDEALEDYTVPELKAYLAELGEEVASSKRAELIEMVRSAHTKPTA